MADSTNESESDKKSGGMMIVWLMVVVVSIGGGFATPLLIAQLNAPADPNAKPAVAKIDPNEAVEFVDFDEVVAVLGKSRFSRYLKINLSMQVAKSQRSMVEKLIGARKALLKNRIISHVSEISAEDLEGRHGHNRLRREMHSFFNELLFDDGIERIQDILFRELQIQ